MKAVVLHENGDPEKLTLRNIADPEPGPDEAVVRLHAAALNRRDVWIRTGKYAGIKLPIILGSDGAGVVSSVGKNVNPTIIGSEVIINPSIEWGNDPRFQGPEWKILGLPDDGTYAEYVKVPAKNVFPKPSHLSYEESAAVPLASLTAYRAVFTRTGVKSGDTVLITGIGGGVACFAMQFCLLLGARVLVTSGNDDKIKRAVDLGAEAGVNYRLDDWVSRIKSIVGKGRLEVVIDGSGGESFDKILDVVSPGGSVTSYGTTLGIADGVNIRRIYWKQLNIWGSTMGTPDDFCNAIEFMNKHKMHPVIDKIFSLSDAALAHRRMEQSEQFGKIVLSID
jgi:zinc-binding alcohol dehydrogenase/oxidoreductase